MESGIKSSFIPSDAGQPQQVVRVGTGGIGDLLLVLGIVALAASVALGVAVFLYQQYLQTSADSHLAQLKRAQEQFEPTLVQKITRLEDRMHNGQVLLDAHVAPSALFDILNQITLKTISYSSLDFDAADPRNIQVKMQGVGHSVNSIALQDDLLSQSGIFTSPIFSNIDRQEGGVHFSLTALVNPLALNFVQLTGGGNAPTLLQQPPVLPAQASTTPTMASSTNPQSSASTTTP